MIRYTASSVSSSGDSWMVVDMLTKRIFQQELTERQAYALARGLNGVVPDLDDDRWRKLAEAVGTPTPVG